MPGYYANTVSEFRSTPDGEIENALSRGYERDRYADLKTLQIRVWRQQISALRLTLDDACLKGFDTDHWGIIIEFPISRRMGRIDCVLLVGTAAVVLEFKSGSVDSSALIQVEDYALDLKYFHRPSRDRSIFPIVVGENHLLKPRPRRAITDDIEPTRCTSIEGLAGELFDIAQTHRADLEERAVWEWDRGAYHPVPSVVEAAVGMFQEMEVDDIAHADADVVNLTRTVDALRQVITRAATTSEKVVCFVTGVPGAGKTLAGLKLVHDSELRRIGAEAAFLSGNEPLVTVLRSALSRDIKRRMRENLRFADRNPKTCIQLVYAYKKTEVQHTNPTFEHVLVFDEAQRAWDVRTTQEGLAEEVVERHAGLSEPGLILSILDRHQDWAVMVALIGEGQEINTGEAGLPEWGRTLVQNFRHWKIIASHHAIESSDESHMGSLFSGSDPAGLSVAENSDLHLDNPNRQFRGRTVAEWANAVLSLRAEQAEAIAAKNIEYPIMVTRNLVAAKKWAKVQSRGSERFGIICSSGAKRLRADGITVPGPKSPDVDHWFLGPHHDVRASFKMEIAATEFQVQGLEIDWAVLCWGGDLSVNAEGGWNLREFRGPKWQNVNQAIHQKYLVNTYRVLLTRARQGFVIYVPTGDLSDSTHAPHLYDATYEYICKCGAIPLG